MATTSTNSMLDQWRSRLLDYVPGSPFTTLNVYLGGTDAVGLTPRVDGRLFLDRPSDKAAFPYGVMRIVDNTQSTDYDPNRYVIQLEVMLHGNKASHASILEDAADVCDKAMNRYVDSTSGITWARDRSRSTAPATSDPAFREAATVRLVYELVCYPLYLNSED